MATRVPSSNVVAFQSQLSWEELAAIPEVYATAWTALFSNLELKPGLRRQIVPGIARTRIFLLYRLPKRLCSQKCDRGWLTEEKLDIQMRDVNVTPEERIGRIVSQSRRFRRAWRNSMRIESMVACLAG